MVDPRSREGGSRPLWSVSLGLLLVLGLASCVRAGFFEGDGAPDERETGPRDQTETDRSGVDDLQRVDKLVGDQTAPLPDGATKKTGAIVPLYADPPHGSWTALIQAKQAHPQLPVLAVVNVNSGPGSSSNSSYQTGIAALSQAGVVVLGYVWTNYGARQAAELKLEIDRWSAWYGASGLKGILFSGQANTAGHEAYYKDLSSYAKASGLSVTVGEPGVDTLPSYIGTVDTLIIYENVGLPALASLGGWHANHDRRSFGVLAHGVPALDPSFVAGAKQQVGFIYLTDDKLPDPWDTLSSYFAALLTELGK